MFQIDHNLNPAPVEVEAMPFGSLQHFVAWLETMPGHLQYCYTTIGHCLVAQYFKTFGVSDNVGASSYCGRDGIRRDLPTDLDDIAFDHPRTFGAALTRTREAIARNALAGEAI